MEFLKELSVRNYSLYLFGWICLTGALFSFYMIATTTTQVNGINAWIKPAKFFISTFLFVWTMGWFLGYLSSYNLNWYNWVVILVLAFELIYISIRAGQGQLSHFNVSSAFNGLMFSLMGLAISIMTLATLYIGYLFFKEPLPHLPITYVWGIRLGIIIFVLFAFEGGLMGSRLSHTVGAADGTPGLQLLNWSVTNGDLRIAQLYWDACSLHITNIWLLSVRFTKWNYSSIIHLSNPFNSRAGSSPIWKDLIKLTSFIASAVLTNNNLL